MITFEALRRLFNEEKNSHALQQLPENFFSEVRSYLEKKSALAEGEDKLEVSTAKETLEELLNIRERKIVNMAIYAARSGAMPEGLESHEKELFDRVFETLKNYQEQKKKLLAASRERLLQIAVSTDIPRFVGMDMRNYGPYRSGDIASLPEENAKVLIEKGAAQELKIGK